MVTVHLICGKICAGKSTLARTLAKEKNAVILSCDEIMRLFPQPEGDAAYAEVSAKVKRCLLDKAAEIAACGLDVVLDWGFWRKAERADTTAFFACRGISAQWYYLDISDARWRDNIARRNAAPGPSDYYVDEGLLQKCLRRFEAPETDDTWIVVSPESNLDYLPSREGTAKPSCLTN